MFAAPPSNNTVIYVKDLRLVEEDIFTMWWSFVVILSVSLLLCIKRRPKKRHYYTSSRQTTSVSVETKPTTSMLPKSKKTANKPPMKINNTPAPNILKKGKTTNKSTRDIKEEEQQASRADDSKLDPVKVETTTRLSLTTMGLETHPSDDTFNGFFSSFDMVTAEPMIPDEPKVSLKKTDLTQESSESKHLKKKPNPFATIDVSADTAPAKKD